MPQSRQITDPDNRFGLIAFSNLCPIPPHAGASVPDQRSTVHTGASVSLVPFANSIVSPDPRVNAQSLRCCFLLFPKSSLGIFWLLCQSLDCVRVQTQRRFQPSLRWRLMDVLIIIKHATPYGTIVGALFCHPRRASRQIRGYDLANTGACVPDQRSHTLAQASRLCPR